MKVFDSCYSVVQPFTASHSKTNYSYSAVWLLLFKNFPCPFNFSVSHSAVQPQKFSRAVQLFDIIHSKIFFSHSMYLFWTVCGPVSYPFTCRAFSHSNRYCKECFRVTGYIFVDCHGHCYDFYDRQMLLIWQVTDQVQIIFTKCGQILL